jgi:tripartite-type tricarboxylate transporter receptor subunit TctC
VAPIAHALETGMPSSPHPVKDLAPIANVATTTFAIAVHPSVPVHTLKDLVA